MRFYPPCVSPELGRRKQTLFKIKGSLDRSLTSRAKIADFGDVCRATARFPFDPLLFIIDLNVILMMKVSRERTREQLGIQMSK